MLAREVGALLDVHPGDLIVDCTFGAGGHSRLLARDLDGSGQIVAIDRDPTTQPFVDALRATVGTGVQVRPMHGSFAACLRRLLDEGAQAGAVLMDLGMSSMQVDSPRAASATRRTRHSTCAWIPATRSPRPRS